MDEATDHSIRRHQRKKPHTKIEPVDGEDGARHLTIDATVVVSKARPASATRATKRSSFRTVAFKPASDALPARAPGDAGRADGDGRSSGHGRGRRLRPASASAWSWRCISHGQSHLRADRRPFSTAVGVFDFEAAGGAPADGQAGDVPRRGGSGVERRSSRRGYASASTTPGRATPARAGYTTQIGSDTGSRRFAPGRANRAWRFCRGLVRRHGALCDQRRRRSTYMKDAANLAAGRHRCKFSGAQGADFLAARSRLASGICSALGPDRAATSPPILCADRQRRRAVGRDPRIKGWLAGHRHRFRRRRPVPRRRSMRCAGFTPNASSTSWFPPTTSSATPSR